MSPMGVFVIYGMDGEKGRNQRYASVVFKDSTYMIDEDKESLASELYEGAVGDWPGVVSNTPRH